MTGSEDKPGPSTKMFTFLVEELFGEDVNYKQSLSDFSSLYRRILNEILYDQDWW